VVHGGRHHQGAAAGAVHQKRSGFGVFVGDGHQRALQNGRHPRVTRRLWLVFVGDQFGLHRHANEIADRFHDVFDGGYPALGQRHQPGGHQLDLLARGRAPMRAAGHRPGAHVENPLVRKQFAVADVEGLVLDQQADDLAVGDVDDRLARLRIAVARLGVGQRPDFVEGVQVGSGQAVGLTLVEVAAQPDVPVGQGEQGFGLGQQVQVERGFADVPWIDGEGFVVDHDGSNSARSVTTTSAPLRRRSSAWPTRSTPTT
jgi:hypothetical protein